MEPAEDHLRELLKLPAERRAHAAKLLLDILDEEEDDPDAEILRAAELTRAALDGSAETMSAEEERQRIAAPALGPRC
jgi:hypothetical protein